MADNYVVIMAGGRGERFWPQSRLARPKHLLPIVGEDSMLGQTLDRLEGVVPMDHVLVITNVEQREAVLETCPRLSPANVIAEPVGRDTAPAVGLATLLVKQRSPEAVFALLPADHVIMNKDAFGQVLRAGFALAEKQDCLVTIGIQPTHPATGYGYIQKGGALSPVEGVSAFKVERFVEKPDLETACDYLKSGDFYWNAGMFIWSVASIQAAFESYVPELSKAFAAIENELQSAQPLETVLARSYPELTRISIDYAVMEKATNVLTLEALFDWDDVGEWPAVARHFPADAKGNVTRGQALVMDGKNNIVMSSQGHLTAVLGLEDVIVVQTEDATLICPRDRAQDIKKLVQAVAKNPDWKHLV